MVRVAILILLAAGPAVAQERGPGVLRLPSSTRALALGNVFPVGSTDSDGIFYHAAFPDRLRGVSSAAHWWGGSATLYTASGAIEWWGGGLAVGVRALDYGGADTGDPGPVNGEGRLRERVSDVISERALSVAFARRIRGLRAALTAHLVEQRAAGDHSIFPATDLGVGYESGLIALALSARNIGASYTRRGGDVALPLQFQLTAAARGAAPVGALDVTPALSVLYDVDGEVVPAAGVEVSYWPISGRTFSVRLGARRPDDGVRPFTAGAGFTGDRLILDYAVVPLERSRVAHRFGIRLR